MGEFFELRYLTVAACLALVAGCATTQQTAGLQYAPAARLMRQARSPNASAETRAANYLQAAAMTAPMLGTGTEDTPARDTYNAAAIHRIVRR
jgi:hypothetical protein